MTGHTYLIIKASTSIKSDIEKDKPYYKIADITPAGIPSTYTEKWSPFVYETINVEHPTAKIIESFTVIVESEDLLYSTVNIAGWASHRSTTQEKLVEIVNAVAANAKIENKNVKPQWRYDKNQGLLGAVVQSGDGCVWIDVIAVPVQPMVNYGAVQGQLSGKDERSMGMGG